jgi:hypothetical protein
MKDMKNIYNYQQPSYLHFIHILKKTEDMSHYHTCQKQQEVVPFSFLCHCFSTLTRMRREGVSCSIVFNQINPDPAVFDRIQPCQADQFTASKATLACLANSASAGLLLLLLCVLHIACNSAVAFLSPAICRRKVGLHAMLAITYTEWEGEIEGGGREREVGRERGSGSQG